MCIANSLLCQRVCWSVVPTIAWSVHPSSIMLELWYKKCYFSGNQRKMRLLINEYEMTMSVGKSTGTTENASIVYQTSLFLAWCSRSHLAQYLRFNIHSIMLQAQFPSLIFIFKEMMENSALRSRNVLLWAHELTCDLCVFSFLLR